MKRHENLNLTAILMLIAGFTKGIIWIQTFLCVITSLQESLLWIIVAFAGVLKPCSGRWWCGDGDVRMNWMKTNCMFVDSPGSLEDQQDPVHLCHLGHPKSDRRESTDVNACLIGSIKTCWCWESKAIFTSPVMWRKNDLLVYAY